MGETYHAAVAREPSVAHQALIIEIIGVLVPGGILVVALSLVAFVVDFD